MIGVFAATDVFLFYVFFEAMLDPDVLPDRQLRRPARQYAAMKFFLYCLVGGLLMLAAVIGLYVTQRRGSAPARSTIADAGQGARSTRPRRSGCSSASSSRSRSRRRCGRSTPGCPTPAPRRRPGAAVLLVGVLDKVGTFGFLRYCLPLFPRRVALLRAGGHRAGGDRHPVRARSLAIGQTRHEAAGRLHLGVALRLHRAGHLRVHHARARPARRCTWSTTASRPARCSSSSGLLIARRGSQRSPTTAACRRSRRCSPGSFLRRRAGRAGAARPVARFVSEFLVLVGTFTSATRCAAVLATTGIVLAAIYILLDVPAHDDRARSSEEVAAFRDLRAARAVGGRRR